MAKGAKGVAVSKPVVKNVTIPASAADFAASSISCPAAILPTKLTPAPIPEEIRLDCPAPPNGFNASSMLGFTTLSGTVLNPVVASTPSGNPEISSPPAKAL